MLTPEWAEGLDWTVPGLHRDLPVAVGPGPMRA